ncbi:hypothetical protein ACFX13_017113 [Malus domestica]
MEAENDRVLQKPRKQKLEMQIGLKKTITRLKNEDQDINEDSSDEIDEDDDDYSSLPLLTRTHPSFTRFEYCDEGESERFL